MMQEQLSGSRERVDEDDSYDQWTYIADALGEYYKDRHEVICAELDGLLSFSGIFSAVVTLFVGQALNWLQPDNVQYSANILFQISQQISNQTMPPFPQPQASDSKDDAQVVHELSLWFLLSLVISLAVSIASLWAKTCISKYLLDHPASPYDRALIQLYRNHILQRWLLNDITTYLANLLLISVTFFCYGLSSLAGKIKYHPILDILSVINTLDLVVGFASTLVPLLIPSWPLKPLLRPFRVSLRTVRRRRSSGSPSLRTRFSMLWSALFAMFRTVEERKLEGMRRHQVALELEALTFANRRFWGTRRLYAINELFKQVDDKEAALDCITRILSVDGAASSAGDSGPCTVHPPTVFSRNTQADKGLIDHLRKVGQQILDELEGSENGSTSGYGQPEGGSLSKYRKVFASASTGSG